VWKTKVVVTEALRVALVAGATRGCARPKCFKANVERIVMGLSAELEDSPITAVGVTPGWLRSEKMLESFGVTEANWRDACSDRPGFGISESPTLLRSPRPPTPSDWQARLPAPASSPRHTA